MRGLLGILGAAASVALSVSAPAQTAPRVEGFVLEWADPATGEAPRTVGLVRWARRALGRGVQLERDVRFADGGPRVLHVERLTPVGARLVWRELGSGQGRSVQVEWSADGLGLDVGDWAHDGSRRAHLAAGEGAVMPLYLLELARHGRVTRGTFDWVHPLSRSLERVELTTSYGLPGEAGAGGASPAADGLGAGAGRSAVEGAFDAAHALRTVELVRADGTLAGRFLFRGASLERFQWQDGGLLARRVEPDELERLGAELEAAEAAEDAEPGAETAPGSAPDPEASDAREPSGRSAAPTDGDRRPSDREKRPVPASAGPSSVQ